MTPHALSQLRALRKQLGHVSLRVCFYLLLAAVLLATVLFRLRLEEGLPRPWREIGSGFLAPKLRSQGWSTLAATGKHVVSPLEGTFPNTTAQLFEFLGREQWPLFPGLPPMAGKKHGGSGKLDVLVPINRSDEIYAFCGSNPNDTAWEAGEGRWAYDVGTPMLIPYVLPQGTPGRSDAAVVVVPGGGFKFLAIEIEGTDIAEWLNSLGISAFLLKYRVSGERNEEQAVIDAQRAVSLVRSKAPGLTLNSSRVGIIGFSAGGEITGAVATLPVRIYEAIDDVDRISSHPDFVLMVYPVISDWLAAQAVKIGQQAPEAFMAIGESDPCCPSNRVSDFYMNLKRSGAPLSELHIYAAGGHGFGRCTLERKESYSESCVWTINAKMFLYKLGVLLEL